MLNMVTIVGKVVHVDLVQNCVHVRLRGTNDKYKDVTVVMSDKIMDNVRKYCAVDDLMGVKGSLSLSDIDTIEAEKITFLAKANITKSDVDIDNKGGD